MMNKHLRQLLIALLCLGAASCGKDEGDKKPNIDPDPGKEEQEQVVDIDLSSAQLPPKELRGAWVATVWGIDWPKSKYDETSQKELYTKELDLFQKIGLNAVFFQVRSKADAFYKSEYEPWSKYITGKDDRDPGYDVLKWLIDETHKRGMQFHAWMNPYRISSVSKAGDQLPDLDPRIPEELTKTYLKQRIYNPALPAARERICAIVKELLTKYDVDGLHMDDYFYPSTLEKGESMGDEDEYAKYGSGYSSIEDFRRANVSALVRRLHETIAQTKPEVIFSIAPQGNYDNNYNRLYIDVEEICREGWIDIIIPQLYNVESTFKDRLDWFGKRTGKTHYAIGYGTYMYDGSSTYKSYTVDLFNKIWSAAKGYSSVEGAVYYNTTSLMDNKLGLTNIISSNYSKKALVPYFCSAPEASVRPAAPSQVKITGKNLTWKASPGAKCYAVYKVSINKKTAVLVGVTEGLSYTIPARGIYCVTALSKENAESEASKGARNDI